MHSKVKIRNLQYLQILTLMVVIVITQLNKNLLLGKSYLLVLFFMFTIILGLNTIILFIKSEDEHDVFRKEIKIAFYILSLLYILLLYFEIL